MMKTLACLMFLAFFAETALADVKLPALFCSNMVVQRETKAPFWGWAEAGEKVSLSASWGAQAKATAGADGTWRTTLDTPPAGGPFTITVSGANTIKLENVLSGEVWLCSGQS
ncbi:MAG: sialate O-acetylesterase, partial [Lentisphaeria bacterium]|nr:sialate O-acetylesterase [Lentisphaeria bacterium]